MSDETRPEEPGPGAESVIPPELLASTAVETPEAAQQLRQAVEISDIGPCKKHIKVTVNREDIDARFDEKYSEIVFTGSVSGFRPGKAPRTIIERRYQKDVAEQVRGEVLLASLQQMAEENLVAPLAPPDIDPGKIVIPKEGPLIYEFDVEVRPEFDLPNYRGLKLRKPVTTFTDADVDAELRRILHPYSQLVPKEASSGESSPAVALGDHAVIDITIRDGDRVLHQVKEAAVRVEARLALRDSSVAEKFGEQIVGARPGESRTVDLALSDRVADASLRGKTVQMVLDVKDIKVLRMPELTHEFCHRFGVHSGEQLRELIRTVLERRLEYAQRQEARRQVLAQITEASQWELPRDLIIRQARAMLTRRVMDMRAEGITEEEIQARMRVLQRDTLVSTTLALKEQFVLQKIADVEKIEIDENDIEGEIDRMAAQYDESPRRLRARLEKEEQMDALAASIVERKALDLVLNSAEYEEVPLSDDEAPVATLDEQAVPGELHDPTAAPEASAEAKTE